MTQCLDKNDPIGFFLYCH